MSYGLLQKKKKKLEQHVRSKFRLSYIRRATNDARDRTNVITTMLWAHLASILAYIFSFFLKQLLLRDKGTRRSRFLFFLIFSSFLGRRINMLILGSIQETLSLAVYVVKIAVHFVTTPVNSRLYKLKVQISAADSPRREAFTMWSEYK